MDLTRAEEITSGCVQRFCILSGLVGRPVDWIFDLPWTLDEMIEALRVVEAADTRSPDAPFGTWSVHHKVAPRGLAALYVLAHYDPDADPIVLSTGFNERGLWLLDGATLDLVRQVRESGE